MAALDAMVRYLDRLLDVASFDDWPGALNGLQVGNSGRVVRVVAAVDGSGAAVAHAAGLPGTLLLVHHGLFWGGVKPLTGAFGRKIRAAIEGDVAVYSSHLPLDAHARFGNNRLLARGLGLSGVEPFLAPRGRPIGLKAACSVRREVLARRVARVCGGRVHVCPGGPSVCRCVAVLTGGGWSGAAELLAGGVDTFVTGEGPQHSYIEAEEAGINVIYGGHYATETLGVKALAGHLSRRFRVRWEFFDHPTGL